MNVTRQLADPDSLLNCIRRMIAIRKQNPVLGWGDFEWLESDCESVAAYRRASGESQVISLNNLSPETRVVRVKLPPSTHPDLEDLFSGARLAAPSDGILQLKLGPYQYHWLKF